MTARIAKLGPFQTLYYLPRRTPGAASFFSLIGATRGVAKNELLR